MDPYMTFGIRNTYRLLSGESTLDDILEESSMQSGSIQDHNPPIFFLEPDGKYDNNDIDTMINHFEKTEEYEKCALLLKLKHNE